MNDAFAKRECDIISSVAWAADALFEPFQFVGGGTRRHIGIDDEHEPKRETGSRDCGGAR